MKGRDTTIPLGHVMQRRLPDSFDSVANVLFNEQCAKPYAKQTPSLLLPSLLPTSCYNTPEGKIVLLHKNALMNEVSL